MYYYIFIAEMIINVSIQHVDFKRCWVRTHDMAEKLYFKNNNSLKNDRQVHVFLKDRRENNTNS